MYNMYILYIYTLYRKIVNHPGGLMFIPHVETNLTFFLGHVQVLVGKITIDPSLCWYD